MHWDLRFRLSLSFLLFGKSPLDEGDITGMDTGGGGRGGGLCADVTELDVLEDPGNFEFRGAGIGLPFSGFTLFL